MRRKSLKDCIYAREAITEQTESPVTGESYRNDSMTQDGIDEGLKFAQVAGSREINETMFLLTSLVNEIEKQGGILWCPETDYDVGNFCRADNYSFWVATQPSGPSNGGSQEPVEGTLYWELASITVNGLPTSNANIVFASKNYLAQAGDYVYAMSNLTVTLPLNPYGGDRVTISRKWEEDAYEKVSVVGSDLWKGKPMVLDSSLETVQFAYDSDRQEWELIQAIRGGQLVDSDGTGKWLELKEGVSQTKDGMGVRFRTEGSKVYLDVKLRDNSGMRVTDSGVGLRISSLEGNSVTREKLPAYEGGAISAGAFGLKPAPVGFLFPVLASESNIEGFLPCDGRAVDRIEYGRMFESLDAIYGDGDGRSTFNLPDYRGAFLVGEKHGETDALGVRTEEGLPNVTGWFGGMMSKRGWSVLADGRLFHYEGSRVGSAGGHENEAGKMVRFDSQRCNPIYGGSHVLPNNYAVNYFTPEGKEAHAGYERIDVFLDFSNHPLVRATGEPIRRFSEWRFMIFGEAVLESKDWQKATRFTPIKSEIQGNSIIGKMYSHNAWGQMNEKLTLWMKRGSAVLLNGWGFENFHEDVILDSETGEFNATQHYYADLNGLIKSVDLSEYKNPITYSRLCEDLRILVNIDSVRLPRQMGDNVLSCSRMFYNSAGINWSGTQFVLGGNVKSLRMMFDNADMRLPSAGMDIPPNVTDCTRMFNNSFVDPSGLLRLNPYCGAVLDFMFAQSRVSTLDNFIVNPNIKSMVNFLNGTQKIKSIPEPFWPVWKEAPDLSGAFSNTRLESSVPADKLWNSGVVWPAEKHQRTFRGSALIANYSEIPNDWK